MTNGDYIRNALTDSVLVSSQGKELLCEIAYLLLRNKSDSPWICAGCPLQNGDEYITSKDELLVEWLKAERKEKEPVEGP